MITPALVSIKIVVTFCVVYRNRTRSPSSSLGKAFRSREGNSRIEVQFFQTRNSGANQRFKTAIRAHLRGQCNNKTFHESQLYGCERVSNFLCENQEAAITSLKEKVDNLKTSLNGEIIGREADKRIYSAVSAILESSSIPFYCFCIIFCLFNYIHRDSQIKDWPIQGQKIRILKKEINELKTIVDEMMSTMLDLAAAIADLKHESLQPKVHLNKEYVQLFCF